MRAKRPGPPPEIRVYGEIFSTMYAPLAIRALLAVIDLSASASLNARRGPAPPSGLMMRDRGRACAVAGPGGDGACFRRLDAIGCDTSRELKLRSVARASREVAPGCKRICMIMSDVWAEQGRDCGWVIFILDHRFHTSCCCCYCCCCCCCSSSCC